MCSQSPSGTSAQRSDPPGSVSRQLAAVKQGDPQALAELWRRYSPSLLDHARRRLSDRGIRISDEEDVVVSAFAAFFRAASNGQYPDLNDRHGLWRMLLTITVNKVLDLLRRENCEQRGGGRTVNASGALPNAGGGSEAEFQFVESEQHSPEFAAILLENLRIRLQSLNDPTLQRIAVLKLEGHQNAEIAELLSLTVRTIERKLALIRKLWSQADDGSRHGSG